MAKLARLLPRAASTVCLSAHTIPTAPTFSSISPKEVISHLEERTTVCGMVASANYAIGFNGQATFLILDRPYPRHVVMTLIGRRSHCSSPFGRWKPL